MNHNVRSLNTEPGTDAHKRLCRQVWQALAHTVPAQGFAQGTQSPCRNGPILTIHRAVSSHPTPQQTGEVHSTQLLICMTLRPSHFSSWTISVVDQANGRDTVSGFLGGLDNVSHRPVKSKDTVSWTIMIKGFLPDRKSQSKS